MGDTVVQITVVQITVVRITVVRITVVQITAHLLGSLLRGMKQSRSAVSWGPDGSSWGADTLHAATETRRITLEGSLGDVSIDVFAMADFKH